MRLVIGTEPVPRVGEASRADALGGVAEGGACFSALRGPLAGARPVITSPPG